MPCGADKRKKENSLKSLSQNPPDFLVSQSSGNTLSLNLLLSGKHSTIFFKVKVKVTQLCPALCNPLDYTVLGVLQARILEWKAVSFSRGSSQPRNTMGVSCIAGGFSTD